MSESAGDKRRKTVSGCAALLTFPQLRGCCICARQSIYVQNGSGRRSGGSRTFYLVTDTIRDAIQKERAADGPARRSGRGFPYTAQACF